MPGGEWVWDDPSIEGTSTLYRRVPNLPSFLIPDLEGGSAKPSFAALKWDPDGISMYRLELLVQSGLKADSIKNDPSDLVFGFMVRDIRDADAGVTDTPDPEDTEKGQAHSSVRHCIPKPDKPTKKRIREKIIATCWRH